MWNSILLWHESMLHTEFYLVHSLISRTVVDPPPLLNPFKSHVCFIFCQTKLLFKRARKHSAVKSFTRTLYTMLFCSKISPTTLEMAYLVIIASNDIPPKLSDDSFEDARGQSLSSGLPDPPGFWWGRSAVAWWEMPWDSRCRCSSERTRRTCNPLRRI